ncbi:MAG: ThiJ/PfpI protein [Frankiales bacterium]|nr:ThiJ/PfpI protein [Frankiales bacterium]
MAAIETIGVLGYEQVSEQDLITPLEIFRGAALVTSGQIAPWQREVPPTTLTVKLLGAEPGVVSMQMGTQVIPDAVFADEDLFDLLYVPGGVGSGKLSLDEKVLARIRRHHDEGKIIASNCSGIGVLARAGILGDTPVTCVAAVARGLRAEGVNVPDPRRMWLGNPDSRLWTATGSYGVHGAAVALISHYFGREVATVVSMMFDTLGGLGEAIFELTGPEFFQHADLETTFQDYFEAMLLPAKPVLA